MKKPKLKKPTLKLSKDGSSNLKPPKLATDLYADLRDRRLLPLIAVLAVAIVAVLFLLADKSSPKPDLVPAPAAVSPTKASFSVVPAKPELREYDKRLRHRKRESPFSTYAAVRVPNETREQVEGVLDTMEESGRSTSTTEAAPTETPSPTGATAAPENPPAQPPVIKATVKANVGFAAVLKVGFVDREPQERKIEGQTKLPNEENPAIVYTGISPDQKGVLLLMTSNVTAFYGDGKCVVNGPPCQQLKLELGKSATFAIGFGETRYKVTLLGFVPIVKEEKIERGG
jgi:hypothetical protein